MSRYRDLRAQPVGSLPGLENPDVAATLRPALTRSDDHWSVSALAEHYLGLAQAALYTDGRVILALPSRAEQDLALGGFRVCRLDSAATGLIVCAAARRDGTLDPGARAAVDVVARLLVLWAEHRGAPVPAADVLADPLIGALTAGAGDRW